MEKYLQLEKELKKIIESAEPHALLPSLSSIMKGYGVSSTTARKALSDLANQGIIYTVNGKGSFVSPNYKCFPEIYCVFQGIVYKNMYEEGTGLFPLLLEELCTALTENNMEMIFSLYKNSLELERQILQRLPEKHPYGAILYITNKEELMPFYAKLVEMIPNTVFVDRYIEGIKSNYVGTDNVNATEELMFKLKGRNFDKIYFIDTENPKSTVCKEREEGFIRAIEKLGFEDITVFVENNLDDFEKFCQKLFNYMKKELKKYKRICIFGVNSVTIGEIFNVCREDFRKLKQVSFVCFEKPLLEKWDNLSLIWAEQNVKSIASACVEIVKANEKKRKIIKFPAIIHEEL